MVRLDRIYTGGGDAGETSLAGGGRVAKQSPRMHAIGDVDEANAAIGLARAAMQPEDPTDGVLAAAQNDLFDLGADLALPGAEPVEGRLRIVQAQVDRLEAQIDAANEALAPLTSFVLPGGTDAAARLHLARTVARRAERAAWALAEAEPGRVNPLALVYLNRLSDLLFVLARRANDDGRADVLWQPGRNAGG
jgi:cob(I)alamin adenosyltransferase